MVQDQPRGLLGRTDELVETDLAIARSLSGTPQILLVGGDAGIGKTTLLAAVSAQARERGCTVLTGHCLDIDAGIPLDPVREALHEVVSGRPDATLPPVTRRLAPFLRAHAAPVGVMPEDVLADLRFSVAELVGEAPLMLVLEDMHWADRSTQDIAVMLALTVRGPFVLVLTFRAEEVTRRHPFRRALVEIARSPAARRIDLGPLDRTGIAGIVKAVTGADDPSVVSSVLARSGGNPLFAEELLAAPHDGVPEHLGALLLARIDALAPGTRALIRLASVAGSRIDLALLREAAHLGQATMDARLREALDANVLSSGTNHLQFRHGLVRDAAYHDLLPDERIQAHTEFANVLQSRVVADESPPSIGDLSALAYHWAEARETSKAFVAHLRAGQATLRYGAPESIDHLERVLDLWTAVPEPEELGGTAKPEVLRLLAEAAAAHGDFDRSDRYVLAALDALDTDTDPLLASRVYTTYGDYHKQFDDRLEQGKALEMAVAIAEGRPSRELAIALATLATRTLWSRSVNSSISLARRAVDVAVAADCPVEHAYALWALAMSSWEVGRCHDALDQFGQAAQVADQAGASGLALHIQSELSYYLLSVGKIAEAIALAESGRKRALSLGLPDAAALLGEQTVEALRDTGEFDDAERLLEEIHACGMHEHRWRNLRAELFLARGDLQAAVPLVLEVIARLEAGAHVHELEVALQVDVFSALGRIGEVLPSVEARLEDRLQHESPLTLARAACTAYTALVSAKSSGVEAPEGLRSGAASALARALDGMSEEWSSTFQASEVLLATALARSLDGDAAVSEWRAAEAAAAAHGDYRALCPRLGLAEALLANGDRVEARGVLLDVWQSARKMRATGYEDQAARMARRNRIPLPGLEELPPPLALLTPREREVFELLATGATNRAIGERLFITEKTASVHVSNIMYKLGVTNRGTAAALARDLTG